MSAYPGVSNERVTFQKKKKKRFFNGGTNETGHYILLVSVLSECP